MRTESITDNLYVFDAETGEKHKLGHIKDIELTTTETVDEQKINMFDLKSFSCEIKMDPASVYYLYLLRGEKNKVPNNWLKHHGFPMNRRKMI